MAPPQLIEHSEREWLFKVTKETSMQPERDLCLLGFFFATPCTTLEINRIQLGEVLHKSGQLNKQFLIRGNKSYSGLDRDVYLKNQKLKQLIIDYIDHRVKNKIGMGDQPDEFFGLDQYAPLFFTNKGSGFSVFSKKTPKGTKSYSCDALNRHMKQLMNKAGVENPSILTGRRTFAVTLKRKGFDVAHIHHLLGNKTIESTTKLLTTDPIDMGWIAAEAF